MRALRLAFAVISYLLFFLAFLYLVGFVGNLVVPKSVDSGQAPPLAVAIIVDVLLIALFGIQHSVMARPRFKQALVRGVHPSIERSVYVLATVVVLALIFALWQPIPGVLWSSRTEWLTIILWSLFALGWVIVFISTWLLSHFELFGLQQAWFGFRNQPLPRPKFREPLLYRYVRHPIYLGFLLAFWSIPTMTFGHLIFAIGMTCYVLIAIRYEERDLMATLGDSYRVYRSRVGMLVPGLGKVQIDTTSIETEPPSE